MQVPATVEIETGPRPARSVIWLHGLGADGHDFEPIVPELGLGQVPAVRFVFPHAPRRPVTINGGMPMRAWYDILTLDRTGPQDEAGIRESAALVERLVERERERGSGYGDIVLAGFSQCGAIALHTALRHKTTLAGVIALSTWLPLAETFSREVAASRARELPILMAHGSQDPVLPLALGLEARRMLEDAGFEVEWHEYPMPHAVCAEEIAVIARWLKARLRLD